MRGGEGGCGVWMLVMRAVGVWSLACSALLCLETDDRLLFFFFWRDKNRGNATARRSHATRPASQTSRDRPPRRNLHETASTNTSRTGQRNWNVEAWIRGTGRGEEEGAWTGGDWMAAEQRSGDA